MPTQEQHSWVQNVFGVVGELAQSAETAAGNVVEAAESTASSVVAGVETAASSAVESAAGMASAATESVGTMAAEAVGGAASAASFAASSAADAAASAVNIAESVAPAAAQGLELKASAAVSSASGAAGAVSDQVATSGSPSLEDLGAIAVGGAVHLVAGAVPFGFLGAAAIDAEVAAKGSKEQKFWYGVGTEAAGVADMVIGGGEIVGGIAGAGPSAGLSLAVSAEGVNAMAAGAEAMTAGALLMSGGPGSPSGPSDPPEPSFEAPITNHGNKVTSAEGKVSSLEGSLDEELGTVAEDESIMSALEGQKRAGKFDPDLAAQEAKVKKDVDLLRRSGTELKEVQRVEGEIDAIQAENTNLATEIEKAADVERTLSTEKADRFQRSLKGLSGRLSNLTARLKPHAEDQAIDLQVRVQKLAERLKKL
jgi:hypothetical protein